MPTYADAARLRELEAKATPAPWKLWGLQVLWDKSGTGNLDGTQFVCDTGPLLVNGRDADGNARMTWDAHLICELRNALPQLLDELEKLRADASLVQEAKNLLADPIVSEIRLKAKAFDAIASNKVHAEHKEETRDAGTRHVRFFWRVWNDPHSGGDPHFDAPELLAAIESALAAATEAT